MSTSPQPPKMLAHCPLCQTAYEDRSIRLLGELASPSASPVPGQSGSGMARMFHLTCASCCHAVLAVILENQNGVSSVGLVTDLEAQDAVRIQNAVPITADDCVAAHELLESKSREICTKLFQA
ncbi:MAG TPA: hypothetical protein VN397_00715 [Candidatus Methylomirabilis sp.]|nr:hypothetical protein [Candidatus Methylomirabilis sp.]